MNINWKLRLQNKVTLVTLLVALVSAGYCILAAFGITPSITQEQTMNLAYAVIDILIAVGVVVDPTTKGFSDSTQAMSYEKPRNDKLTADGFIVGEEDEIDWTISGTDE